MLKNLKIGQKLVFLLMLISIIPLLAISVSNYFYAKRELEQKTINALQAVTNSRAAHINSSTLLRQEQAKEVAGAFLLRQLRESGLNDPQIIEGIQADIDSTLNDLKLEPTSDYRDIDRKTDIEIIGVWDVHGNNIANTRPELIGMKMPLDYIKDVYDQGTCFRGFEKDPLTGKEFLIHLEEIRNWQSGMIVGAVSLKIRGQILNDITASREGLGHSGETYVVDNKYRMITQSRFIEDSILKTRVFTEATRACFEGVPSDTIYTNYRGAQVLGVHKYLPDQQWCLVAEINAEEAFAPVEALRNRTLLIGFLLILVVSLFAYLASYSFSRPITHLADAAQQVARGKYDVEVPVESRDEIGLLAGSFNNMARSLERFTRELEEKNKALFKNLAISTRQRKELKEVNAELDSFVYTVSHDLRAPLRGIASFASFLEEDYSDKLNPQAKEYIDEIRKGAAKMAALIDDLLTLSRISRIKNPFEDVDMKELVDSVVERIKFDIKHNNVDMRVDEQMPVVYCDRIKMGEVFLNLVNNAIKFSAKKPKGRPRVEVGYAEDKEDHKFYVRDNGIGIAPQHQDQIFGIFKRLHTDKEYEGTGAGLSIVKRVIDDHQGKIWVESELGRGATFYLTIPKNLKGRRGAAGEGQDSPSAQKPPETPEGRSRAPRIEEVDDES